MKTYLKPLVIVIVIVLAFLNVTTGQTIFQQTIGGINNDLGNAVQQTPDGGYIIAGETSSYGAGGRDVYLVKLDNSGNTDWSKTFGENLEDYAYTIDQTIDNGYIIGAHTGSFGQGGHDYYLIKTDINGDVLFTKSYGGTAPDGIYNLHQVDDGFILGGHTSSYGTGGHDYYFIKTDVNGNTVWTKTYGGVSGDFFRAVVSLELTANPSYVLVGETSGFGAGGMDILVIRTNGITGDIIWSETFGGSGNDYAYGIYETSDSGLIIVGHTNSFGAGGMDIYIIKIDFSGTIQWSKTYGGANDEFGYAIQQTSDNGYIIVGSTTSFGAGAEDVYLIKTDANGNILWTKAYGGTMNEVGYSIQQTTDGGYIITGNTSSFGAGQKDIYVIKADTNGYSGECNELSTNTLTENIATITSTPSITVNSGTIEGSSITISNDITPSNLLACEILGINSLPANKNQIKVFPNPFRESTTIKFNYKSGNYTFLLYTTTGQLIRKIKDINSNQIRIEKNDLAQGLYFFQLQNDFEVIGTGKLIIK